MKTVSTIPAALIAALVVNCISMPASASPQGGDDQSDQVQKALEITTKAAKNYRATVEGKLCELHTKPVLRWSNPVVGNVHGNVFLWTNQKRPVAVGSFFKWFAPWTHGTHEFHSLATQPLKYSLNSQSIWAPQKPGVKWQPLKNFAAPLSSKPARLSQMRRIARQFSAQRFDRAKGKKSPNGDTQTTMRLLTQPVYRYESKQNNVVDGSLFAFVQGTDPEVWLLIEARSTESEPNWVYSIARMNATEFRVKRDDRVVWKCDRIKESDVRNSQDPFFKINTANLPVVNAETPSR